MDPKFQSSFIPKGPSTPASTVFKPAPVRHGSLLGLIARLFFTLSIIGALLVVGYGFYLKSSIGTMNGDLELARAGLEAESIEAIARLDARIKNTGVLLDNHRVLIPLFDFLEANTLRTVRFTFFDYKNGAEGLTLSMRGQARGYAALALQADIFNNSPYIKSNSFSDLDLDEKGNVTFLLSMVVDPSLVSYERSLESAPLLPSPSPVTGTSTAATSTVPATNN
jgi:hypothetical protein